MTASAFSEVQISRVEAGRAMAPLKLVVLSVCVALASAFVPMAAPLSRPAAASPACSGIVMIRAPPLQTPVVLAQRSAGRDQPPCVLRGQATLTS